MSRTRTESKIRPRSSSNAAASIDHAKMVACEREITRLVQMLHTATTAELRSTFADVSSRTTYVEFSAWWYILAMLKELSCEHPLTAAYSVSIRARALTCADHTDNIKMKYGALREGIMTARRAAMR